MSYSRLALFLFVTGCTQTEHVVSWPALETKHPVSASSEYLDREGTLLATDSYDTVLPFHFTKEDRSDHANTESGLQLGPELDRLVQTAKGDAVTKLRVEATSFGTRENAVSILGLSLDIAGGILLVPGLASLNDHDKTMNPYLGAASGCLLGGGLLILIGEVTKPTSWQFSVTGDVVRSRAPTPDLPLAKAVTPGAAAP